MSCRWTEEEAKAHGFVKDKHGNWQPAKVDARIQRNDSRKVPKLEPDANREEKEEVRTYRADAGRGKQSNSGCVSPNTVGYKIVVTAHCRRHTDPDNLCPKYFIDRLREFRLIPDDSSEFIAEFIKRVKKVEAWEPEVTEIEVFELT